MLACLDLEGVLLPEIWIAFAEKTGIEQLRLTTRDISEYDELMQGRLKILKDNRNTGNLMPKKKEKGYKTVLNLLRTLGPMEFEIRPKNSKDGEGFILHPFDMVDKNTTLLNYMFDAVFFLPLHIVKNALISPVKKKDRS